MLNNNKVVFAIALIASIVLWAYCIGGLDPNTSAIVRNVPIRYENLKTLEENGYTVLSKSVEEVNVSVAGQRSVVGHLGPGSFRVTVDLEDLKEGTHEIRLRAFTSENVSVNSISPLKVTVVIDKLVTKAKNVNVVIDGARADGKEAVIESISLSNVNVTGPETLVDMVDRIEARINTVDVDETANTSACALTPVDENGIRVDGVYMDAENVSVVAVLYDTKNVNLILPLKGEETPGYVREVNYTESITIKGACATLDGITSITAHELDISNITEDKEVGITVTLPRGVTLAPNSVKPTAVITVIPVDTFEPEVEYDEEGNPVYRDEEGNVIDGPIAENPDGTGENNSEADGTDANANQDGSGAETDDSQSAEQ